MYNSELNQSIKNCCLPRKIYNFIINDENKQYNICSIYDLLKTITYYRSEYNLFGELVTSLSMRAQVPKLLHTAKSEYLVCNINELKQLSIMNLYYLKTDIGYVIVDNDEKVAAVVDSNMKRISYVHNMNGNKMKINDSYNESFCKQLLAAKVIEELK